MLMVKCYSVVSKLFEPGFSKEPHSVREHMDFLHCISVIANTPDNKAAHPPANGKQQAYYLLSGRLQNRY